jgi:hypothetical protein
MTDDPFKLSSDPDPQPGVVAALLELPTCNFCPKTAHFDFATRMGPWAYGCFEHYFAHRAANSLGTGKGQRLVVRT